MAGVKVSSTARSPVNKPVCSARTQWGALRMLERLPGMQVMHALVGCQKRWTNRTNRRFHGLGIAGTPVKCIGCIVAQRGLPESITSLENSIGRRTAMGESFHGRFGRPQAPLEFIADQRRSAIPLRVC